jgi:hypothetical protein
METIEVLVSDGDTTKIVKFVGKKLAELYKEADSVETLYWSEDGRKVVHSYLQSEESYFLYVVTDDDLNPGGVFEDLGNEWEDRPLTLDEGLSNPYWL